MFLQNVIKTLNCLISSQMQYCFIFCNFSVNIYIRYKNNFSFFFSEILLFFLIYLNLSAIYTIKKDNIPFLNSFLDMNLLYAAHFYMRALKLLMLIK